MIKNFKIFLFIFFVFFFKNAHAFDPAAGKDGSRAVSSENKNITGWAEKYIEYKPGEDVDEIWQNPKEALGPAEGNSHDIVCLGRGGYIIIYFPQIVKNYDGIDFAVFENSFSDYFLELAHVSVSSNSIDYTDFKGISLTKQPVPPFGRVEPENIYNFAGKYRAGYGTGFDLDDLRENKLVKNKKVDLDKIKYIKIQDIPGDGSFLDSLGNPVYDPFPSKQSAGFDLDGVCLVSGIKFENQDEDKKEDKKEIGEGFGNGGGCFIKEIF